MVQLHSRRLQTLDIYDRDFYAWLQRTTELVREQRFAEIDAVHLTAALEQLQRQERRSLKRLFMQLAMALLQLQFDQTQVQLTVKEIQRLRYQVLDELADSPSLTEFLQVNFDLIYTQAYRQVLDRQPLSQQDLPEKAGFSLADALDTDFFPEVD